MERKACWGGSGLSEHETSFSVSNLVDRSTAITDDQGRSRAMSVHTLSESTPTPPYTLIHQPPPPDFLTSELTAFWWKQQIHDDKYLSWQLLFLVGLQRDGSTRSQRATSEPRSIATTVAADAGVACGGIVGGEQRSNGWATFIGDIPEPPPPPRFAGNHPLTREKKVTICDEAVQRLWC